MARADAVPGFLPGGLPAALQLFVCGGRSYKTQTCTWYNWNFEAELTLYAETDSYTVESTEALRMDQLAVLNAFADPNIQVGDRSIMLQTAAEAPGPGEAYVKFTASGQTSGPALWMRTQRQRARAASR